MLESFDVSRQAFLQAFTPKVSAQTFQDNGFISITLAFTKGLIPTDRPPKADRRCRGAGEEKLQLTNDS